MPLSLSMRTRSRAMTHSNSVRAVHAVAVCLGRDVAWVELSGRHTGEICWQTPTIFAETRNLGFGAARCIRCSKDRPMLNKLMARAENGQALVTMRHAICGLQGTASGHPYMLKLDRETGFLQCSKPMHPCLSRLRTQPSEHPFPHLAVLQLDDLFGLDRLVAFQFALPFLDLLGRDTVKARQAG